MPSKRILIKKNKKKSESQPRQTKLLLNEFMLDMENNKGPSPSSISASYSSNTFKQQQFPGGLMAVLV